MPHVNHCVPDVNCFLKNRVDFFLYKADGGVVRNHPGRSVKHDMSSYIMLMNIVLFHRADDALWGVGSVLHAEPLGIVERGGIAVTNGGAHPDGPFPLVTRAHMD